MQEELGVIVGGDLCPGWGWPPVLVWFPPQNTIYFSDGKLRPCGGKGFVPQEIIEIFLFLQALGP